MNQYGVLMMSMGGPRCLGDVEPFLKGLFSDPHVIQLPLGRFYQGRLAGKISKKRAPIARKRYELIGGKSPLPEETARQARALEKVVHLPVTFAMQFSRPGFQEAFDFFHSHHVEKLVLLPMYPQYSSSTSGSAIQDFKRRSNHAFQYRAVESHFEEPRVVEAFSDMLKQTFDGFDRGTDTQILFAAHSIPVKYTHRGDPYIEQVRGTARAVAARLEHNIPYMIGYHSRLGPVKWHGPSLGEALKTLRGRGVRNVVVQPLSFVAENLETLYDLDIEFKEECDRMNMKMYRVPAVGVHKAYIAGLANQVNEIISTWENHNV